MRVSFGLLGSAALCVPAHSIQLSEACVADDNRTKVVCLGASITRGNVRIFSGIASTKPYPQQLWELLGSRYCVQNLGVPGATVLKHSRQPYWDSKSTLAQAQDLKPDIVILQFGANDSKEKNMDKDFQPDYVSMIRLFQGLESRPAVYVLAVPPIYMCTPRGRFVYGMDADIVNSLTRPLQRIARASHIPPPISVFNSFVQHCPDLKTRCSWMAPDGVHPNTRGDGIMANLIYYTIKGNDRCGVEPHHRVECPASTKAQCKRRGCCYEPSAAPQCFKQAGPEPPTSKECTALDEEKTDCGFPSFTAKDCQALGCCWQVSQLHGTPFCFHKVVRWSGPTSTVTRTTTTTVTLPSTTSAWLAVPLTWTTTSTTTTAPMSFIMLFDSVGLWPAAGAVGAAVLATVLASCLCVSKRPPREIKHVPEKQQQQPPVTSDVPHVQVETPPPVRSGNWRRAKPAAWLDEDEEVQQRLLQSPEASITEDLPSPCSAAPEPLSAETDAPLYPSPPRLFIPTPRSAEPDPLPTPPRPPMPQADPTLMLTPQMRVAKEEDTRGHAEPSTADASESVVGAGQLSESSESSAEASPSQDGEETASEISIPLPLPQVDQQQPQ